MRTERGAYKGEPCFPHENAGVFVGRRAVICSASWRKRRPPVGQPVISSLRKEGCRGLASSVPREDQSGLQKGGGGVLARCDGHAWQTKNNSPPGREHLAWLRTPPSGFPFSQRPSRTAHASSETLGIGVFYLGVLPIEVLGAVQHSVI